MACFSRIVASKGICPPDNHWWLWEVFQEAVCKSTSFSSICLWRRTRWHSRSEWLNSTKLLSCGYHLCTKWQNLVMKTMQCINLFKHDYYRFVCNTLYSFQKGKNHLKVNDSILALVWIWGGIIDTLPYFWTVFEQYYSLEQWQELLITHMKHWCLASKVDECFWWCRVSEIYMGRCNLQ